MKTPSALARFSHSITNEDIATMSDHELAALAAIAPAGMTAVFDAQEQFAFINLDCLSPSQRASLRIVGRSH
jgi:hypothetical protein